MARIVKEENYNLRRIEILDAARRMVYTKGYEQMTIQNILDQLRISKGAFYHYFDSKQALLEALVEHMMDEVNPILLPIVEDPALSALEKFQKYFGTVASWKTARKPFLMALLRIWYHDDNAIVRQKMTAAGLKRIAPILSQIIHQGIREGTLTTCFPDQIGEILLSMSQGMNETFAEFLLDLQPDSGGAPDEAALMKLEEVLAAYSDAFERILGAPKGSIQMFEPNILREWFTESNDSPPG